jgi:hypothetical protein
MGNDLCGTCKKKKSWMINVHATGVVLMDYSTKLITSVLVDKFFGQYGYDYVTAGRKCVSLFTQRGMDYDHQ